MKDDAKLYFNREIKMFITPDEYEEIKNELQHVPEKYKKAFCNIVLFGFSIDSAYRNCKKLYEFVTYNEVDYETALSMVFFLNTPEETGIYSRGIPSYSFN